MFFVSVYGSPDRQQRAFYIIKFVKKLIEIMIHQDTYTIERIRKPKRLKSTV